jgi:hypothetical protein
MIEVLKIVRGRWQIKDLFFSKPFAIGRLPIIVFIFLVLIIFLIGVYLVYLSMYFDCTFFAF